jgi:hypothetical protein
VSGLLSDFLVFSLPRILASCGMVGFAILASPVAFLEQSGASYLEVGLPLTCSF